MSAPTVITTGHNSHGKAVVIEIPPFKQIGPNVGVLYATTDNGAVDTNNDADLDEFKAHDFAVAGLIPQKGAVVLVAEWPPGADSSTKSHRTQSVDVGVMIQGEIECVLDSGDRRIVKTGEILIQRGTKHHWVNQSATVTARMVCFVLPSKPVEGLAD